MGPLGEEFLSYFFVSELGNSFVAHSKKKKVSVVVHFILREVSQAHVRHPTREEQLCMIYTFPQLLCNGHVFLPVPWTYPSEN